MILAKTKTSWKGKMCDSDGNLTLGSNSWTTSSRPNKKRWSWKTSGSTKTKDKIIKGFFYAVGIGHHEILDI